MFNWLNKKVVPKKDEKWVQKDDSPWPTDNPPVTILDCKEDWVRYSMSGAFFQDERMELPTFLYIYTKVIDK